MLGLQTISETLHFVTDDQSMWGSGAAPPLNETWTLFSESFSGSLSEFDGDVTASISASVGLQLKVTGDSGDISLDYPLNVQFYAPNSVAAGQLFTVQTSNGGLTEGTPHFKALFPQLHVDLDAVVQIDASLTVDSDVVPDTPWSVTPSYNDTVPPPEHCIRIANRRKP